MQEKWEQKIHMNFLLPFCNIINCFHLLFFGRLFFCIGISDKCYNFAEYR